MRAAPTEAWILAGTLGGGPARPALLEDVCGMPYVLRLAADLAHAGATRIYVVWEAPAPAAAADVAALERLARDERLRGAELRLVTELPAGPADEPILLARADRIYHRDFPKLVVRAWREASTAAVSRVEGDAAGAVLAAARATAARLAAAARTGAISLEGLEVAAAPLPYLGFAVAAPDRRALRRAETQLVWSLRKQAQGIAAYWINRHFSLRVTRAIMRTPILPNHVTVFCFLLALAGGIVIGQGGYVAGAIGMALVNLGSILDGVDGELARLKYRFSSLGAWLDTLADDFGNVAYVTGLGLNLHAAGVGWAAPLAAVALICFALTQGTQYYLITKVYRSGDLAAIPWAFQSNEFLTARPEGVVAWIKLTVPKLLKRDFALTVFVGLALIGRLDAILIVFSAGAIAFFVAFAIQLVRNLGSVRAARRGHGR